MEQKFMWFAKYNDGSIVYELEDDKENDFYSIDKDKLKEFGLVSKDSKISFDIDNGIFTVLGDTLDFSIDDIKISGRDEKYNHIIQYKELHRDFDINTKKSISENVIDAFHIGYEKNIKIDRYKSIIISVVCRVEVGKPIKLGFVIATNFELKGKLYVDRNGDIDKFPIDVYVNRGGYKLYEKIIPIVI